MKIKLPVGVDNFEKLRAEGFYYVDKTGLVRELLENWRDVNSDIDNLWSVLFTTGYLTRRGNLEDERENLVIPNKEVRWIFVRLFGNMDRWLVMSNAESGEGYSDIMIEAETEKLAL